MSTDINISTPLSAKDKFNKWLFATEIQKKNTTIMKTEIYKEIVSYLHAVSSGESLKYPVPSLNFFCLSFHKVQMRDSEKSSALTRFDCHRACARKCKQT